MLHNYFVLIRMKDRIKIFDVKINFMLVLLKVGNVMSAYEPKNHCVPLLKFGRWKNENVGRFFCVYQVKKSKVGKMWDLTFIRPVHRIRT